MRSQAVWRKEGSRFLILREELLQLFEYDHYPAVVCAALIGWNTHVSNELDRVESSGEAWVSLSADQLRRDCMGLVSQRKIQDCLEVIKNLGVVSIREPIKVGERRSYLLHVERLNSLLQSLPASDGIPDAESCPARKRGWEAQKLRLAAGTDADERSDLPLAPMPTTAGTDADDAGTDADAIIIDSSVAFSVIDSTPPTPSLKSTLNKASLEPPTESTHVQTAVLPASPHVDTESMDLDDDVVTFVTNAYRRENRRAKLGNLKTRANEPLCETLRNAEQEYSPEEFRAALLGFLRDQGEWLVQNRWPLRVFLSQVPRYLQDSRGGGKAYAGEAASPPVEPSTGVEPAAQPQGYNPQESANRVEDAEIPLWERWNKLVPSAPIAWNPRRHRLPAALDGDLYISFDAICRKAEAIRKAKSDSSWLTFPWLFKQDPNTGRENWEKLKAHDLDFLLEDKDPKTARAKKIQAAMQAALQMKG